MAANNRPFILQLPDELLQRIFIGVLDDLTNPTYTASASVCRTFHRMFSELLYQSFVDIDETHPRIANQKVREIADRLRRPENALLIKSLLVMTKGFLREYSVIPVLKLMDSLSILAIAGPSGQTRADFMEVFMASARRSPGSKGTLASLDQCAIGQEYRFDPGPEYYDWDLDHGWSVLLHPRISNLILSNARMISPHIPEFLKGYAKSTNLKQLKILGCAISPAVLSSILQVPKDLRVLEMRCEYKGDHPRQNLPSSRDWIQALDKVSETLEQLTLFQILRDVDTDSMVWLPGAFSPREAPNLAAFNKLRGLNINRWFFSGPGRMSTYRWTNHMIKQILPPSLEVLEILNYGYGIREHNRSDPLNRVVKLLFDMRPTEPKFLPKLKFIIMDPELPDAWQGATIERGPDGEFRPVMDEFWPSRRFFENLRRKAIVLKICCPENSDPYYRQRVRDFYGQRTLLHFARRLVVIPISLKPIK